MRQMTKEEASQHYLIPMDILDEYESWGLCSTVKQVMGQWQYDDQDLERLSLIMTLHDIGFRRKRWKSICGFFWKERIQKNSGWKC